jgi:hypothetical protein
LKRADTFYGSRPDIRYQPSSYCQAVVFDVVRPNTAATATRHDAFTVAGKRLADEASISNGAPIWPVFALVVILEEKSPPTVNSNVNINVNEC